VKPRPEGFSLADAIRQPSFTPRRDDVPAILDMLVDDDRRRIRAAEGALLRLPDEALARARERLGPARAPLRGRLARIVARLAPAEEVARLLRDEDPKTRRVAAIAMGRRRLSGAEEELLAYAASPAASTHEKPIADALGKVGGAAALSRLKAPTGVRDVETRRVIDTAIARIERTAGRATQSRIEADAAPDAPTPMVFVCRAGIEPILTTELGAEFRPRPSPPGRVEGVLTGPLRSIFRARTFLRAGFPLAVATGDVERIVATALTGAHAKRILQTWTRGPVRWRIEFASGGHRRAAARRIAAAVALRAPDLVNDPTASTWEVLVEEGRQIRVTLFPKAMEDPRFAWRKADVPAASHPTIAAALVRVAGLDPQAVVWDPFVGSGAELVERGLAGPVRSLTGSDVDPRALEIARTNLRAAGLSATLVRADSLTNVVHAPTLILTNPPMGRRSVRDGVEILLDRFVDHAAKVLAPGGRLVWISPFPDRTRARAARAHLELTFRQPIDMGGFTAEMQAYWAHAPRT